MLELLQNREFEVCRVGEGCGGSGKAVPVFACSGNEGITVVVCSAKWHTYFKAMIETRRICRKGKKEGALLKMECNDKLYEKEKGERIFDGSISRLGSEFFLWL